MKVENTQPHAAAETPAIPKVVTVDLYRFSDHKGTVRFNAANGTDPLTSVYVSRKLPGINGAKAVRVTIEVIQ